MKRKLRATSALAGILAATFVSGASAQVRTSPTYGTPAAPELLLVYSVFDASTAKAALDAGRSAIRGIACSHTPEGWYMPIRQPVYLLPVTPYLEEWLNLRKNVKRGQVVAPLLDDAFAIRVETKTDDRGRFQFTDMKPGRYYVFMDFSFNRTYSENVYAGTSSGAGVSVDHYESQARTEAKDDFLEKVVEVKRDGETVKAPLVQAPALLKLLPCM